LVTADADIPSLLAADENPPLSATVEKILRAWNLSMPILAKQLAPPRSGGSPVVCHSSRVVSGFGRQDHSGTIGKIIFPLQ
jgi:hypothetical protein